MSTCFDVASQYLRVLRRKMPFEFKNDTSSLNFVVKLLKNFVLYARQAKSNSSNNKIEEMLGFIEAFFSRMTKDIESAYLSSGGKGALIEINRCREDIKRFGTDINQLFISLLDDHYYSIGGHLEPLKDLFHSLSERLMDIRKFDLKIKGIWDHEIAELKGKLLCSWDLIEGFVDFAKMQGVDQMQLVDLLIHVEVLAVDAACLIYSILFNIDAKEHNKNKFVRTCQLLQKMKPLDADLQLREAYIHVLAVSKLSTPSTHIFSLEKDDGLMVAAKFMRSLKVELQQSYARLFFSLHDGMQKLHQGVTFLCILVGEQHDKFTALDDELKDLIGVVVIDTGILIWSISLNELEEGLTKEIDVRLSHLLQLLKLIMAEVEHIHSPPSSSAFGFPTTNELGSIDFLLENLKELASCDCETSSIALVKDQICIVQKGLQSLRSFLENIAGQRSQNIKLQTLWNRVMEVAHKAEFVVDSVMLADKPCSPMSLNTITKEIKVLEAEALEICGSMSPDNTKALRRVTKTPFHKPSQISPPALNENLVGLEEEVRTIIDGLTRGSKQLDILSIVGMPGIGKTTLANAVYNHDEVMYHFHIRAWCTVSQCYSKRDLLLQLLGDTVSTNTNEADLAEMLYKRLKGNRYLIILDDVWDIEGLNLLRESFPDDENESRILFTSRRHDLCSLYKADSKPHPLRLLSDAESWKLLQNKIFGKECCPPILSTIGMQIAKACQGLPLAAVVVAGVLANIDQSCWEEVANNLSSSTVVGMEHCMKTLELSYTCLPNYLKPCLLYFGAFKEDADVPVQRLLRLWISEGFVQNSKAKSLEAVANEYLMDLINRSLVMVIGWKSIGGVKICRIHDLLHEFCVAKAEEESFLQSVHWYDLRFTLNTPYNCHRLSIYNGIGNMAVKSEVFFPHLRSLLIRDRVNSFKFIRQNCSFTFRMFKLLRVLDIGSIHPKNKEFLREVELLVHLRYLAIAHVSMPIPSGIANLSRLETFVIKGFLQLRDLELCSWIASCDNFPCLEKLVLHWCGKLEGVPSSLGDIPTLQMIEVKFCCKYAENSVKQIQKEQMDMGNESLKIVIHSSK